MYLIWISLIFSLILNIVGLKDSTNEKFYYYLNSDIEIDSISSDDLTSIRVISGDFACTKCLEELGDKFGRNNKKQFIMVYETLSSEFSRDDLLSKVISARAELSSKLRAYDGEYKIVFSLRPISSKKTPFLEVNCKGSIVRYSYDQLFNQNVKIDYCD